MKNNNTFSSIAALLVPRRPTGPITVSDRDDPPSDAPLSDEQIEYWANVYVANNFRAHGVLFETFMRHPQEIAGALLFRQRYEDAEEFLPLLPAQADAAARIHRRRAISRQIADDDLIFIRRQAD